MFLYEKSRFSDKSLQYLTEAEADECGGIKDETLGEIWRGETVKGGACKGISTEESIFDRRERIFPTTPPLTAQKRKSSDILIQGTKHSPIPIELTSGKGEETTRVSRSAWPVPNLPSRTLREASLVDLTRPRSYGSAKPENSTKEVGQLAVARYTFRDAFCGAGGMSRGAKDAGFRIQWGFDHDQATIHSYGLKLFGTACNAMNAHDFVALGNDMKVDVLHLNPPCQIFSPAHTVDGKDDERNGTSFFAVPELIKKARPRMVTFENTSGLEQRHELWFRTLIDCFISLNFNVHWKIVNCTEYSLAQARKGSIVIAS